jgi:hypothetical protein
MNQGIKEDLKKAKRSGRAKQAARTRVKRQNMRIYERARDLVAGRLVLTGHSTHCRICGKALTDEPSRSREVGPECWARVMQTVEAVKISDMGLTQADFDQIGVYDTKTGEVEGLDVFDLVALKFKTKTKAVRGIVARSYAVYLENEKEFLNPDAWTEFCKMGKEIVLDVKSAERVLISMKRLFDAASLKVRRKPFDPYKVDLGKVMMERSGVSNDVYSKSVDLEPFREDDAFCYEFPVIANAAFHDVPLVQMAAAHIAFSEAEF